MGPVHKSRGSLTWQWLSPPCPMSQKTQTQSRSRHIAMASPYT